MSGRKNGLQEDDFPLRVEDDKVKTRDGDVIVSAYGAEMAADVADRLNEDANRKQEDNWSA